MAQNQTLDPSQVSTTPPQGSQQSAQGGSVTLDPKDVSTSPPVETGGPLDLSSSPSRLSLPSDHFTKPLTAVPDLFGRPMLSEASKQQIAQEQIQKGSLAPRDKSMAGRFQDVIDDLKTGGRATPEGRLASDIGMQPLRTEEEQMLAGPVLGAPQIMKGVGGMVEGGGPGGRVGAANDIFGGAMQSVAPAAALNPEFLPTVVPFGIGQHVAEKGLEKAGVSPETSELASNVVLLAGGMAAEPAIESIAERAKAAADEKPLNDAIARAKARTAELPNVKERLFQEDQARQEAGKQKAAQDIEDQTLQRAIERNRATNQKVKGALFQSEPANVAGREGMGNLAGKEEEINKPVRQAEARESSKAAVNEQIAQMNARDRGDVKTRDLRSVAPTTKELELPNTSQGQERPDLKEIFEQKGAAQSQAKEGLVPAKAPSEEAAKSSAPAGLVMPLGDVTRDLKAGDMIPEKGKPVKGQYQETPAFGNAKDEDENVHPVLKSISDAYGKTDNPEKVKTASFINPDGSYTALDKDHPQVIKAHDTAGEFKSDLDNRVKFINDTGAIRSNYRESLRGDALHLSVPKDGVSDSQVDAIKRLVEEKLNGRGDLYIETAQNPTNIRTQERSNAKPDDVEYMLHKLGVHPDDVARKEGVHETSVLSGLHANGLLNPQVWRQAFPSAVQALKEFGRKGTSEEKLTPELKMKGYIRSNAGEANRSRAKMVEALGDYRKSWDKRTEAQRIQFITNEQRGLPHSSPEDAAIAKTLRGMFQERRTAVENLGVGAFDHWREHYFPQIWEKPGQVQSLIRQVISKRPYEGSRSFTKARVFGDIQDGLNAGYKPLTTNPIDLAMMKLNEMDKYIAAHQAITEARDAGIARHLTFGTKRPASMSDWVKIDDRIGVTNKQGNIVTKGNWYAPKDAAKVINNYLSPGLRGNKAYDIVRDFGNQMNQFQLGWSAFHVTTTAVNSAISDMAMAVQKLSPVGGEASKELMKGNFAEAGRQAGKGLAAAARTFSIAGSPTRTFLMGNRLLKEYMKPGAYAKFSKLADAVTKAGGETGLNAIYKSRSIEKFQAAVANKNFAKAAWHLLPAVTSYVAKPVMEWTVPRMKLGAFADMANRTLDRAQREGWDDDRVTRQLGKDWNSIDGRFGQVNYDNIFVNKVAKDLAFLAVRSAGWTGGTVAELGGGAVDAVRQVARLSSGDGAEVTNRMAYTMALPITMAYLGSVLHYAYTGKAPATLHDAFQVPTGQLDENGRKERVNLPSYMKDYYAFKNDPVRTLANKLHPLGQQLTDLIRNADYRNVEIRHPDDPLTKQMYDVVLHEMKEFIPLSFQNAQREGKLEGKSGVTSYLPTSPKQAASVMGITPSPSYETMSPAEKEASEYERRYGGGQGVRTTEQAEQQDNINELRRGLRTGKVSWDDVLGQLDAGKLSQSQVKKLYKEKDMTPLERQFHNISDMSEALKIWNMADKSEKGKLQPLLLNKWKNMQNKTPEQREQFLPQMDKVLDYDQGAAQQ